MLLEEAPACRFRGMPQRAVRCLREGREAGEVHLLPRHLQPRAGQQFRVARGQPRLLLHIGGDRRVEGGDVHFPEPHRMRARRGFQRGAVGQRQQPALQRHGMVGGDRRQRIGGFAVGLGPRVLGILREAQVHQG